MEEIMLEDYLNNSGTRGTEKIYKTGGMSIKRYRFKKNKDGSYTKENLDTPIYKVIRVN
jgi:hypothetical protein